MTEDHFARLASILSFDRETGEFRWAVVPDFARHLKVGAVAGTICRHGYRVIGFERRYVKAHRLAFFVCNGRLPLGLVDHINGDKADNRIENLRECLAHENGQNSKVPKNNTSGYPGVSWYAQNACWIASIRRDRKNYHLGYFDRPQDAYAAYREAKADLHTFAPDGCDLPDVPSDADSSRRRLKQRFTAMLSPKPAKAGKVRA